MKGFKNRIAAHLPVISVLLALLVFVSGCTKKQAEEIRIGVILPLTGPIAMGGNRVLHGVELAVDEFNVANDKKVVLKVEDSRADPSTGVNAINKLIRLDKVKYIIGDLTSSVTLAIAPLAEQNRIVLLAPGASNPAVRVAGDYIFRNWVSDDFDGIVAASYLNNVLGIKRVTVLYIQNDYGLGLKNSFIREFERFNGTIVHTDAFDQGLSDFRTIIGKFTNKNYEAIYIAGQPSEMGYLIRQMKEYGISTTIFSNASVEEQGFQTTIGDIATTIYYTSPAFDLTSKDSLIVDFVSRYKMRFREDPDIASAHGYDAARMILGCISEGNIKSDNLKYCLYQVADFAGVTGNITIDEYGDAIKGLMVKRFFNRDSISVLDIYYPTQE